MPTFKPVVRRTDLRKDKTYNVKIRLTHHRKSLYLKTPFYVAAAMVTRKGAIKDRLVLDKVQERCTEYARRCVDVGFAIDQMSVAELVALLTHEQQTEVSFFDYADGLILKLQEKGIATYNTNSTLLYTPEPWLFAPAGMQVYADKECTTPAGRILTNMSGSCTIDTYPNIYWSDGGTTQYIKGGVLATERAVVHEVQQALAAASEPIVWDEHSNLNRYTQTGIYHAAGYRKSSTDNLPITNVDLGDKCNVAFTLIVDRKDGYYASGTNIPDVVSQTLLLANRQGSETKIYTRHYQYDHYRGTEHWEPWRELVASTYLGQVNPAVNPLLDTITENGLYTGIMLIRPYSYTFTMQVINNYALATAMGYPARLVQHITGLDVVGNTITQSRKAVYESNAWVFGEWE